MIELSESNETDPGFAAIVERTLNNAVQRDKPRDVYVVQVDGWFDYKWEGFSGTEMHEIALWAARLTIPPFNPSRILQESYFRLNPTSDLYETASAKPLHVYQASVRNLRRFVRDFSSSGLFVWYSHVADNSDRASLMHYTVDGDAASGWYAGFTRKIEWRLAQVNGASRKEVDALLLPGNHSPNTFVARGDVAKF